jgi:hypothetical protein
MRGVEGKLNGALIALTAVCVWGLCADTAFAAAPEINGPTAASVSASTATLKGSVNPKGMETSYRFAFGLSDCSVKPSPCKFTPTLKTTAGEVSLPAEAELSGLSPATVYHFLLEANSGGGKAQSTDRAFATLGLASEGLPDGRAYEQSSPVNKDGGDALGKLGLVSAATGGNGISFLNTFGIPGGKGAQALPSYLALRGPDESGWATQGLLPPPVFGERARVQGWLPDFSRTYSNAERLGSPRKKALVEQRTSDGMATPISPYTQSAEYSYVGASPDASTVFFESRAKLETKEGGPLIDGTVAGRPNLYVWSRATGEVSLAGALNTGDAPPKGAFAGPYAWSEGINASTLRSGGTAGGYYLQGPHAITASGDIYFTEAVTGQLYLRENPTRPQSIMEGEKCLKEEDACTVHISASERSSPDPAGAQPAAFAASSIDGSKVIFTSPEKLTDQANTGPEQPKATIESGSSATGVIEDETLIERHAVGVAVQGTHVYWADPAKGTIGRAGLNGESEEDFIEPGTGECEIEVEVEPEVFAVEKTEIPSTPRYVAVDATSKYVYWTNSGLLDNNGEPIDGGGTIGRAEIDGGGNVVNVEPAFICGEVESSPGHRENSVSNPQGIAVNAGHIYWANAAQNHVERSIARSKIDGAGVEPQFFGLLPSSVPYGVALSASHVYFALNEPGPDDGVIERTTLEGTEPFGFFIGKSGLRGLALDGTNIYWTTQGEEAIGRVPMADLKLGGCGAVPSCEGEFIKPVGALNGIAADASHLYWSVNGESPTNPGNDLYLYDRDASALEDLTPLPGGNGAEVQGVLGASDDGSRVYFAANGSLDGEGKATPGDCQTTHAHGALPSTSGSCNVYLWHQGEVSLVGRVKGADAVDWTGTPRELFSGFSPKAAFVSNDGMVLLFGSRAKLTAYENEGVAELYRYRAGTGGIACVSCPPSGEAVGKGPSLGSGSYPGPISPGLGSVAVIELRNLSADGNRAFFETAEALVPADTNGATGCPLSACTDVYEWEVSGAGGCKEVAPAYSPLNEGCLYLISTGKSEFPSLFADASESGNDAFFFTRQQLVRQDKDELQDVYDARVGGGLVSQNRIEPVPCEGAEACHGLAQSPPAEFTPATPQFTGPGNAVAKHKKQAAKKDKAKKRKAKKKQQRANGKGRAGR